MKKQSKTKVVNLRLTPSDYDKFVKLAGMVSNGNISAMILMVVNASYNACEYASNDALSVMDLYNRLNESEEHGNEQ